MSIAVVGLNHHTAPFVIREQLSLNESAIPDALSKLETQLQIKYGVILSTCNRCELYTEVSTDNQVEQVIRWLCSLGGVEYPANPIYFFRFSGTDAVHHLFEVASSLKSEIIGEPQILGQVKSAYRIASSCNRTDSELNKLFEHALSTAKRVRSETVLGQYKTSYASIAVSVSQKIFADLSTRHALMIGSGDMIKASALQLKNQNIGSLTISSRSLQNAEKLATQLEANTIALDKIDDSLHRFDLIISCTASKTTILKAQTVSRALKMRKQNALCIVDLALPRDIEPAVAGLENVYLYTLDNLTRIVDVNKNNRLNTTDDARKIVASEVQNFIRWLNTRQVTQLISRLKAGADEQGAEVYQKSLKLIAQGRDTSEVLEYLRHTLTAKLMHRTIKVLNKAATDGDADLIETVTRLYGDKEDLKQ